ncbi:chemotaxis response regulator protein-glutamate methylesterase [Motiliproteus sp. MSK22-1]|uniref:protein-glutamate methylesterase/protein-glutamine glutaminase n=1 Tax=Motiliproteus sp. MSK22-1 TaxID=1897630 RepID=UPI000976B9DC|nr:chemotaxis response regulator protein-glutamate methylesterase [Motiliproteus sp. MSK22-1]OMH30054.1 chemotaxis response regulator protein-glutamate methylesterase [Motiliproteus sp. MSK22-1]
MPVTVLVVDDSAFFRQRVSTILNSDPRVSVIGTAQNGQEAIEKAKQLKPDVITMDYEMPVMNGITALSEIMKTCPTAVLMFSSLTYEGARVTLEALEAGAVDFLPKSYEQMTPGKGRLENVLIERILAVAKTSISTLGSRPLGHKTPDSSDFGARRNDTRSTGIDSRRAVDGRVAPVRGSSPGTERSASNSSLRPRSSVSTRPASQERPVAERTLPKTGAARRPVANLSGKCSLVVFGTSTGGPVAIQKILTKLPASFPLPILIVQHMPKAFTGAFAERLNQQCSIQVREAKDGDRLQPGLALLAPGGEQMMVESRNGGQVRIIAGDERLNYKPSVDITFGSAAKQFPGKVLGIVLTGMGADGREGARMLKNSGSSIWAQNEESCVIYGMPQAIVQAQLADQVLDLSEVSETLISALGA